MKKIVYAALAAAAMTLGASGTANAAVSANPGEAVRTAMAPLQLIEKTHYRRWHHRHHRHCVWRHHRRICWWR